MARIGMDALLALAEIRHHISGTCASSISPLSTRALPGIAVFTLGFPLAVLTVPIPERNEAESDATRPWAGESQQAVENHHPRFFSACAFVMACTVARLTFGRRDSHAQGKQSGRNPSRTSWTRTKKWAAWGQRQRPWIGRVGIEEHPAQMFDLCFYSRCCPILSSRILLHAPAVVKRNSKRKGRAALFSARPHRRSLFGAHRCGHILSLPPVADRMSFQTGAASHKGHGTSASRDCQEKKTDRSEKAGGRSPRSPAARMSPDRRRTHCRGRSPGMSRSDFTPRRR